MKGTDRIQPRNHHQHNAYEVLQDLILNKTGVQCSVLCTPEFISIRGVDYIDFVLARAAIKGRTTVEIIWDNAATQKEN